MKRIFVFLLAGVAALAAAPIRVQVTTGGHPYSPSFHGVLEGQGDLAVTINPHPSAWLRDLRRIADVLVLYDLADVESEAGRKNLQSFVEAGRGIVVIHHAIADNWQWKWWYEEVTGGRFLMGEDGGQARSRAKINEVLRCRPVTEHPVLRGVGALRLDDEAYQGMWLSPKSRVLMETDNPNSDKAVVWIGPHPKARVVVIQMGHDTAAHVDAGFRRLVRNAVFWAAGRLE